MPVHRAVDRARRGLISRVNDESGDEVLDAMDALLDAVNRATVELGEVAGRADSVHGDRARGATYGQILTHSGPLVPAQVTETLAALAAAGSRLRRAEARALYAEGLSMDNIARLFRVSRQRISALLRTRVTTRVDADTQ